MFVIGIPTLNEADNISRLVKQIDEYRIDDALRKCNSKVFTRDIFQYD